MFVRVNLQLFTFMSLGSCYTFDNLNKECKLEYNRILLVDDDVKLCELLADYLAQENYEITCCHDGVSGLEAALSHNYDLIVLDVMLPGMNGLDVLKRIRGSSKVPVLMLTARGEDVDRIVGLELGADDYLPKPFNTRELLARVRAVQRRIGISPVNESDNCLQVGDTIIDSGKREVRVLDTLLDLTTTEFSILAELMTHAGDVVARDDIAQVVLGRPLAPYDRSIDVHISSLRKKFKGQSVIEERIKTIHGVGYMYVPSVNA